MKGIDAWNINYEIVDIDGKEAIFTNMRLKRDAVPDNLFCYDVRDSDDSDGSCAQIANFVLVNHWGTIICKEPIQFNAPGSYYPNEEMDYLGETTSLKDWVGGYQ